MRGKSWRIVRPTAPLIAPRYAPLIFLLLVILSLTTAPVAAQSASCRNDASVMGWNQAAASGTTFTMTKDCTISETQSDVHTLQVSTGKTFTIDGAGYTINAASKALFNDRGTVFNFDGASNITLVLRNLTIDGGGDASSPRGSDPDPAIVVRTGTVILDGVTIQNTRGGAIRIAGNGGKLILKNTTFTGNQVSGTGASAEGTAVTVYNGGRLYLQGLFTAKTNVGGQSAIYLRTGGNLDLYDLGCLDLVGNFDSDNVAASLWQQGGIPTTLRNLWRLKPRIHRGDACGTSTASTTPRPQGDPAPPAIPGAPPTPARPSCRDSSVMGWNSNAASGTTFTMTKDCDIVKSGSDTQTLHVGAAKTFIIDGAGYTIYAADKASANDRGTAFSFAADSNINLLLRNLTIAGGGDASSPAGDDPDPAIVVRTGTVTLDRVSILSTRGGAIRIAGNGGKLILKNTTFIGNQVSGTGASAEGTAVTVYNGGHLYLQNLFTAKYNAGGQSAIYLHTGGNLDLYDLGCLDLVRNFDLNNQEASLFQQGGIPTTLRDLWRLKPRIHNSDDCGTSTASTDTRPGAVAAPPAAPTSTPAPAAPSSGAGGGQLAQAMAMADVNYGRRVKGTLGLERSAYYYKDSSGVLMLQIYRVDGDSNGHWVMNVPQAAIDAVSGPACVAASPDGRYAVRVWADRNITISDGPDHEGKVFHNTLQGGVNGPVIATETTYSSTPPGMGCPGYTG